MARAGFVSTSDGITKYIDQAIRRSADLSGYLNRVVVNQYKQAQLTRWKTENSSETGQWPGLTAAYEARKRDEFASFPGAGKAMMIATGKLQAAATGRGDGFLKVVTQKSIILGIDDGAIPYGKWAAQARPFMQFGEVTTNEILSTLATYIQTGKQNG